MTELSAHTQVYCNHPLIHQLLDTACTLSGYKFTHTDNLHSIIQENPSEFLSKLTSFNIEDEAVLQLLNSKVKPLCDYTNLIEYVEEKVSRLFVDIVTMFPSSIKVQVFQYLQHRDICRSACVSKSWNDASTQSAIWKYLCFSKGWGVAFNLPKKMDWKMFYSTIYVDSTEKTASIRSRFTEEMKGTVGMLAYKKMTSFLYHSPEYTNLERVLAHKTQDLKDVVSFEVANECFIAVEDAMTKFLLNEAMSAGHRIASAKDAVNRKTSLRHRLATILFDYTTGFIFKPKQVHSLIMNVAHKFGILSPALEKIRRKLNHGQTTITVSVDIVRKRGEMNR